MKLSIEYDKWRYGGKMWRKTGRKPNIDLYPIERSIHRAFFGPKELSLAGECLVEFAWRI
jgi:hypothetical protein